MHWRVPSALRAEGLKCAVRLGPAEVHKRFSAAALRRRDWVKGREREKRSEDLTFGQFECSPQKRR